MASFRFHSQGRPSAQAREDEEYIASRRAIEQKRRDYNELMKGAENVPDSALPPGGITSRMSKPDQDNAARRIMQVRSATDPTQQPPPFTGPITGNLDANRSERLAAGAIANSPPPPVQPRVGQMPLPSQVAGQGVTPPVPPRFAKYRSRENAGRTLTTAESNAALGPVTGANGYGTGSVTYAKAGTPQPTAEQTRFATTETGVQHAAPFNPAMAREELFKRHPNIFTPGTPENAAFVAHANKYGEESAHGAADSLMATLHPSTGGPSPASAHNDLADAPSSEALAAMEARQPSSAKVAGQTVRGVGEAIAGAASLPQRGVNWLDRKASEFASGVTGTKQDMHPVARTAAFLGGADTPEALKHPVQTVKNWLNPQTQTADPTRQPDPVTDTPEEIERKKRLPAFSM